MNLDLSLVNILILFGAVQGITFMLVLFASKRHHPGAVYLALAVLSLVYNGLETFNWSSKLEHHISAFNYFPFVLIFLVGPSFYLYQRSLLYPDSAISRKQVFWCYFPFLFQAIYLSACWIAVYLTRSEILNFQPGLRMAGEFYGWYSEPLSVLVYLSFASATIREYLHRPDPAELDKKSLKTQKTRVEWSRQLLVFQIVLALIWPPTVLISYLDIWPFSWSVYYPIEILLVALLYWIAIAGYFKIKAITTEPSRKLSSVATPEISQEMAMIHALMERDQVYRDPELNLALLADKSGLPAKTVSKILNQAAGVNFNDFVNSYRVEAFCKEAEKSENSVLTLQGIAFGCGFSSSATFQRTFKKFKGVTPGAYFQHRREMGQSGNNSSQIPI